MPWIEGHIQISIYWILPFHDNLNYLQGKIVKSISIELDIRSQVD